MKGLGILFALSLALGACAKKDETAPPRGASSSAEVGYALEYPDRVDEAIADVGEGEQVVEEAASDFSTYSEKVKEPTDKEVLASVYRAADEAGRNQAYVEAAREKAVIEEFFAADDGMVGKKVAGGVDFMAKQEGCSAQLGGAAAGSLKRTVEKRLEEKMREANDAHRIIDENVEALGKDNVDVLHEQADTIAEASYVAYIELPTQRATLKAQLEERDRVIATLDAKIEEDQKVADSTDASDDEKKAAEARLTELKAAKDKLEQGKQAHQDALTGLDKRISDAQKKYDDAFDGLLDQVAALGESASSSGADEAETPAE